MLADALMAKDAGGASTNRIEIGCFGGVMVGRLGNPHPARLLIALNKARKRIALRHVILRTVSVGD
jgi:hypothetical protein